ncbi:MAG: type II secretion system protein [Caulobacterales bacterium]|nr:type II secretion system protein [Caulobacterales bacterium]
MNRRAFTLIELLVVVAIVAILAAMLMPALGMVRTAAQAMRCGAQERKLALASLLYTGDNEGATPYLKWVGGPWAPSPVDGMFSEISPYLDDARSSHCPAWNNPPYVSQKGVFTYIYNCHLVTGAGRSYSGLNAIPNHSGRALFACARYGVGCFGIDGLFLIDPAFINQRVGIWHQGATSIVYLDGHVARWRQDTWSIAAGSDWYRAWTLAAGGSFTNPPFYTP